MSELYQTLCGQPFVIAGPCVIESEELCLDIAQYVAEVADKYGFFYIFKASFDKANRTSIESFRGLGIEKGLEILQKVKDTVKVPVTTDIHLPSQAVQVAVVADILQIPAFLCRQTDLLVSAANTGCIVNIKKGQFLSGAQMYYPLEKVSNSGNNKVLLTERGTMFGYERLVVDYTGIYDMMQMGVPVVMDATHAVQQPGSMKSASGGNRTYVLPLALAAAAIGVRGFFFEIHPEPDKALSDGPNSLPLKEIDNVLQKIKAHIN